MHELVHGVLFLAFGDWTRCASVVSWALLLNATGSAGDILMMSKLTPYPRTTRFSPDANDPTYIFTEPRVGYRMAKQQSTEGSG